MSNNLMKSKFFLGQRLFYKTKYGFGISKGKVVGLHDDVLKVEKDSEVFVIPINDVLSIYEND